MTRDTTNTDVFVSTIPEKETHPNYRELRDADFHAATRGLMNELYARMGNPNGNFRSDLQGKGFHARVFELACFAYLESASCHLDRTFKRPDFVGESRGRPFALEVTTANVSDGADSDISLRKLRPLSEEEEVHKIHAEFPRKIYQRLRTKLNMRYHEMLHCSGRPLVLAVSPFFEAGALLNTEFALPPCLYGHVEPGAPTFEKKPFFSLKESEFVSAVMYSNQFTVSRFFRFSAGSRSRQVHDCRRMGFFMSPDFEAPHEYNFSLNDTDIPTESWREGVTLFHNPNAAYPLADCVLRSSSSVRLDAGVLRRHVSGFHPLTSFMLTRISNH